ncbi:MAG TPA: hypothetical protein VEX43_03925 [Chthoniobacterales bacterium]|nr:hypothetical protein [Chthoniobacterales bacterium]
MTVLIIDGDPSRHTVISNILMQRGCHLLEVDGGKDALKIARAEKPAIATDDTHGSGLLVSA